MTAPSDRIDFRIDTQNLYREEGFTDMSAGSIRRLVPVKPDGSDDKSRTPIFVGSSQLMTEQGPLPLQASLTANNLKEAIEAFPAAMEKAMQEMVQALMRLQEEQRKSDDSRIIVPGR
ncbi:MAG: cytoplasmic protein [Desulfosarcinaceae bacterium]|nr:cytoplasmic protein [Desulfosarcinaceae bacterium]